MSFLQGLFGPPDVETLKTRRDVKGLIKTLGNTDKQVRHTAAEALGQIGDARAVDPLIAALKDNDWQVRHTAAGALGQIEDARAVEPLIAALEDVVRDVRRDAAQALGQLGEAAAVDPLIATLKDKDEEVRPAAAEALDKLGWQPDQGQAGAQYWILRQEWDKCAAIGAPAVEPLIAALKDRVGEVRRDAAKALGQLGDTRAVEPLVAALKDSSWEVRHAAARALGQLGDARAVEPLLAALKDSSWEVRCVAAGVLGQIGDARAVEPLIAALKDSAGTVRHAAAETLGQIGDARAVEPLLAALKDSSWGVRRVAAKALGQLGDTRAVDPLIATLKDKDEEVRLAAAEALGQLGEARAVEMANEPNKLHISLPGYIVTIKFGLDYEDTQKLIKAGGYDYVDEQCLSCTYDARGNNHGRGEVQIEIFLANFEQYIHNDDDEIKKAMEAEGFRPAIFMELLFLGDKYPDLQRNGSITALGSGMHTAITENWVVPCLNMARPPHYYNTNDSSRVIRTRSYYDWDPNDRFAVVRL